MSARDAARDAALWPRAARPRRPMLGAGLDALTAREDQSPPSFWLAAPGSRVALRSPANITIVTPALAAHYLWTTTDPAEAWELLQARDLIPMEYVGRFTCETCRGSGTVVTDRDSGEADFCDCAVEDANATGGYRATGYRSHPPTVAALASWVSLGFAASDDGAPGILGAEELAQGLAWQPEVRWRIEAHETSSWGPDDQSPEARLKVAGHSWSLSARQAWEVTLYVPPLGAP